MRVEIYNLNSDGTQSVVATCTLAGDNVTCTGDKTILSYISRGVGDMETGGLLYPKDGARFLSALKNHFKSGYLLASEIIP